jgi:predicted ATPase
VLHHLRRRMQATQEMAEATIALSTEHGFPHWLAQGVIYRGWALAEQGQREEGIAQMREGLAAWRAVGAEMGRPYYLALLAEVHGEEGQAEAGLALLAEALATIKETRECNYEAELYRLKGELLLMMGDETEAEVSFHQAESCFQHAIEVARRQSAKSWELRAATSLSRLWKKQGRREEARQLLAEIYGWFTEGFDTPDLKEAKALLEELS